MSIADFRAWLRSAPPKVETDCGTAEIIDECECGPVRSSLSIWNFINANLPDGSAFHAEYGMEISWQGTPGARFEDAFERIDEQHAEPWEISGLVLLDDETGTPLDRPDQLNETTAALRDLTTITQFDLGAMLPAVAYQDIDTMTNTDTQSEEIIVRRDNERDLRFTGTRIAARSSSPDKARPNYSGSPGRWSELTLYKTEGGKWVAAKVGHTQWQGEKDRFSAAVCDTPQAVVDFFGANWLAKELYEEAGLDAAEDVDAIPAHPGNVENAWIRLNAGEYIEILKQVVALPQADSITVIIRDDDAAAVGAPCWYASTLPRDAAEKSYAADGGTVSASFSFPDLVRMVPLG
jgi:hypothetical protein